MANVIEIHNLTNNDIMYRNFEGIETDKNQAGKRNFVVRLTLEQANDLQNAGFYVKMSKPDKDGNQYPTIRVNVGMEGKWPPEFEIYTNKGRIYYGEDDIKALDRATIVGADIWCNSYMKAGGDHYTLWLKKFSGAIKDNNNAEKYMKMLQDYGDEVDDDLPF